jgi:caa(3)-type oxidase subunit IV
MDALHRSFSPLSIWVALVIATAMTFAAGEFGSPGRLLIASVLLLAVFKGALVILDFMELRHAPALWRRAVVGWLFAVVAGILLAYLK